MLRKSLFFILLVFCVTPWATPPIALGIGLLFGLSLGHPYASKNSKITKILLQVCIVALGFGINLRKVVDAGRDGILLTLATIAGTLLAGYAFGKLLSVNRVVTHLVSSGTAICGGSAIAAVGPVVDASEEQMSISLATVFVLNAVALFIFPPIGRGLALSQEQFGLWSAIAIHDTSSVVGAASRFGDEALAIATTVKLTRALWIVPLTFLTAYLFRKKDAKITVPWFILYFLIASIIGSMLPQLGNIWSSIAAASKIGFKLTLFLIGAGLTRRSLAAVGARPLVLGVILWAFISIGSLAAIRMW